MPVAVVEIRLCPAPRIARGGQHFARSRDVITAKSRDGEWCIGVVLDTSPRRIGIDNPFALPALFVPQVSSRHSSILRRSPHSARHAATAPDPPSRSSNALRRIARAPAPRARRLHKVYSGCLPKHAPQSAADILPVRIPCENGRRHRHPGTHRAPRSTVRTMEPPSTPVRPTTADSPAAPVVRS